MLRDNIQVARHPNGFVAGKVACDHEQWIRHFLNAGKPLPHFTRVGERPEAHVGPLIGVAIRSMRSGEKPTAVPFGDWPHKPNESAVKPFAAWR
jgi:hypothetical protein